LAAWRHESDRLMIKASRLTKRFGSTLAVDELSFTVEPGR
jgi:ABC-type multidrug transport system ATPase subunit